MSPETLNESLARLDPAGARYATEVVDLVLAGAQRAGVSDVHWQSGGEGMELRWRIDGVLQPVAMIPAQAGAQCHRPAQGHGRAAHLSDRRAPGGPDSRHTGRGRDAALDVPHRVRREGRRADVRDARTIPPTGRPGPAGAMLPSASRWPSRRPPARSCWPGRPAAARRPPSTPCLRELAARRPGERSLATLEDPVEAIVPGVAQSQVNPAAGMTLEVGLRVAAPPGSRGHRHRRGP